MWNAIIAKDPRRWPLGPPKSVFINGLKPGEAGMVGEHWYSNLCV